MNRPTDRTVALLASVAALGWGCGSGDIDHRIAARPGGDVAIDIELGSGVSFDHGSLEIASEEIDEVRIIADTSGWGGYAVDVDIRDTDGQVRVVGRVDGSLHWMFGGPTVDFRVVVPHGYPVDALMKGGDVLIEDLAGPVRARVEDAAIALRRSEGDVELESEDGDIAVEDVEGSLKIATARGDIAASGVHGRISLQSGSGPSHLSSVTGPIEIVSDRGDIRLDRVRGAVTARSERGRIEIDDVEGAVDVVTERGRIEVVALDGPIRARSERGGIEVEFIRPPSGSIESSRGSIRIEAPALYGFDLDADTRRGSIEIDRQFTFDAAAEPAGPDVAAGMPPVPFEQIEQLGEQVAAEAQARAAQQWRDFQREWEQWRRTGDSDWDFDASRERWIEPWPWDQPGWEWDDRDIGREYREWAREVADRHAITRKVRSDRGDTASGRINGGGPLLQLRTERGDIRVGQ